jgi:hypothetical protein
MYDNSIAVDPVFCIDEFLAINGPTGQILTCNGRFHGRIRNVRATQKYAGEGRASHVVYLSRGYEIDIERQQDISDHDRLMIYRRRQGA